MADATPTTTAEVPGLRKQAFEAGSFVSQYVTTTVKDPAAREALLAEVKKHFDEMSKLTAEHVTDAEKRAKLLDYAKGFANQAVTAAKDPNTRASLLDKLKATVAVAQEAIKDPAKRQEIHDNLAATTHKLLQAAQAAPAPGQAAQPPTSVPTA
jgi:RecB family exonuclease